MIDTAAAIRLVQQAEPEDFLKARLTLAATVQAILRPHGLQTIVVGGTAVDTYVSGAMGTSESYPADWAESLDIDTIVLRGLQGVSTAEPVRILEAHGFVAGQVRSSVRHPQTHIPVDFVGFGYPDDYSPDHVFDIYMEDWEALSIGPALLAGPEDIVFDYLESAWDTKHQRDWTRAMTICATMADELDLGYLFTKANWRAGGTFVAALEQALRGEPLVV